MSTTCRKCKCSRPANSNICMNCGAYPTAEDGCDVYERKPASRFASGMAIIVLCLLGASASFVFGILSVNLLAMKIFALTNAICWCGAALSFDKNKIGRAYAFAVAPVPGAFLLSFISQAIHWPAQ